MQRESNINTKGICLSFFIILLTYNSAGAVAPPLTPLNQTGSLLVLEDGCNCVLRITPDGLVTVDIAKEEIAAVTGNVTVSLNDRDLAVDGTGTIYFTEQTSGFILKKTPTGALTALTTKSSIIEAAGGLGDPKGVTFGSDGFLYVNDDSSDSVLRVDPMTGEVGVYVSSAAFESLEGITTVYLGSSIVGAEGGVIYTVSNGDPKAIFSIDPGGVPAVLVSGSPFVSFTDVFMARAPSGDLIVASRNPRLIYRVAPEGGVSVFLTADQLDHAADESIDLEGGMAFDGSGNFYVGDEDDDNIIKFDSALSDGFIWVSESRMRDASGSWPDLEGGFAFVPAITEIPTLSEWGMIIFAGLMALSGIMVIRRRRPA